MKKLVLALIVISTLSLSSCKKEKAADYNTKVLTKHLATLGEYTGWD